MNLGLLNAIYTGMNFLKNVPFVEYFRENKEDTTVGIIYFSDTTLGPRKTSFQRQPPTPSNFSKIIGFTTQIWHKVISSQSITPHGDKIQAHSNNFPRSKKSSETNNSPSQFDEAHVVQFPNSLNHHH